MVTERGHRGWVPKASMEGDLIVIMPGGKVPYVLQPIPTPETNYLSGNNQPTDVRTTQHYTFLGDAYIHGFMNGEAYEEEKLEPIILV
jgi:hypothetical protein